MGYFLKLENSLQTTLLLILTTHYSTQKINFPALIISNIQWKKQKSTKAYNCPNHLQSAGITLMWQFTTGEQSGIKPNVGISFIKGKALALLRTNASKATHNTT